MNGEKLMEYLGEIDDEYVREAAPGNRPAKRRWPPLAGLAAAAVLVAAVAVGAPRLGVDSKSEVLPESVLGAGEEFLGDALGPDISDEIGEGPGCAPGYIRWHGYDYFNRGYAVYEFPEGLELLGEVSLGVKMGGILPEDAPDLSSNFGDGGSAYMFPGNEDVIVFRYREWNAEEELGRPEPFLIMYREPMDSAQGESGYYDNIIDMVLDADAIVEGVAVPTEPEAQSGGDVYLVQVTNVLSGDVSAEDEIRVAVPAGSGRLEISEENTYLLFLRRDGDEGFKPASEVQGVYATMRQGEKGEYLLVPSIESYMVFSQGAIRNPPYTHISYAMYGVRKQIQGIAEAEPLP